MAFLKGIKKEVEIPVEINIPALDKKDREYVIKINPVVRYKYFRRSEARKIQLEVAKISQDAAKAFEEGDVSALLGDRLDFFDDLLRDNIVGWRKMPGDEGDDIEFSEEVLAEALEDNAYYLGLMVGLRKCLGWDHGAAEGSEAEATKN